MTARTIRWRDDRGQAVSTEVLLLLIVALIGWGFLAWLGRLTATSQDLANTAQSAARAASQQHNPTDALTAARAAAYASNLQSPCTNQPDVTMSWQPGPTGTWRGGSVTVTLTCTVDNREPVTNTGRTIAATDTQVIDRYQEAG